MKICLVSEEFPEETNYGGIASYHYTLSKFLIKEGHEVCVICKSLGKNRKEIVDGIKIIRIIPFFRFNNFLSNTIGYRLAVFIKLLQEQTKGNFDIIESPAWKGELFIYMFFKKFFKSKIIIKLHGPLVIGQKYNHLPHNFINRINNKIEYFVYRKGDYVVSCSQSLVNQLRKFWVIRKDIKIIHNPANFHNFNKTDSLDNLFGLNTNKNKINLLFAGSHEIRKGIIILMSAMNIIFKKYKNINLYLCGIYGTSPNENRKLTKEEILSHLNKNFYDKVIFLGHIKYKDMPNIYNFVDIGIFPSLYDNFPGVVLESLLMKVATIGSINTGIKEEFIDGEDILFYTPPSDSNLVENISMLLENNVLRQSIAMNGHKKVMKNTFKNLTLTLQLYLEICQSSLR